MIKNRLSIGLIFFPTNKNLSWQIYLIKRIQEIEEYNVEINCLNWKLNCNEIISIKEICEKYSKNLTSLKCSIPETIVSAKALNLKSELYLISEDIDYRSPNKTKQKKDCGKEILFHRGTIRSGEEIDSEGDLFILGDVNPGGFVSANGDVMIWGRLLGIAHAGKNGDSLSTISALHMRPVQLRIANAIAKGPKEKQETGIAEQAKISLGLIVINPLKPKEIKK